jgi:hypothetical protein
MASIFATTAAFVGYDAIASRNAMKKYANGTVSYMETTDKGCMITVHNLQGAEILKISLQSSDPHIVSSVKNRIFAIVLKKEEQ